MRRSTRVSCDLKADRSLSRRTALASFGAAALTPAWAARAALPAPPSVVSTPARQWGPMAPPSAIPDPDIIVLDPSFKDLLFPNANLELVWRGGGWLEGPAWSTEGRFLLLSDTVRSQQYRYIFDDAPNADPARGPDTGIVSIFRKESFNANGNTFDTEGRLVTCEHGLRRVIRWEHDGSCRVLADSYQGRHLNSPNDVVASPDGAIWFTDPAYGDTTAEGHPDADGPANPRKALRPFIGNEVTSEHGGLQRQADHTFRWDPRSGTVEAVLSQDQAPGPNGLCFSPDAKTLYVISSGKAPGQQGPAGDRKIRAFDMSSGRPANGRIFTDFTLDGQSLIPDGMRADVFGNLWCGASGPLGLCGVFIYNPAGRMIGRLRLPVGCSNLTFGGEKRDTLFACCGTSLFSLTTSTQGAGFS